MRKASLGWTGDEPVRHLRLSAGCRAAVLSRTVAITWEVVMGRLDGKVAVVLGAAAKDNMGQVMARRFAAEGASVVVGGRQADTLAALGGRAARQACAVRHHAARPMSRRWPKSQPIRTGVSTLRSIARAGVSWPSCSRRPRSRSTSSRRCSSRVPYFFLQTFCALMSQSGGGSIVTISSASVYALLYNHAAYIGTKAGTDALVRCFANEFGPRGVKINSIAPGLTATPMTERETKLPGLEEAFLKEYPLGRIGTTDDVANAALWLVTDESFLTGQVLQVNGGLTLRRNPSPKEINAYPLDTVLLQCDRRIQHERVAFLDVLQDAEVPVPMGRDADVSHRPRHGRVFDPACRHVEHGVGSAVVDRHLEVEPRDAQDRECRRRRHAPGRPCRASPGPPTRASCRPCRSS